MEWAFYNRTESFVSFDTLATFFGTRRKNGKAADFGKKFFGTPEEKHEALEYCNNDVVMTRDVALAPGTYKHECTDEQHEQLVETLLTVPEHKVLSGYQSPLYKPLLDAGWTLHKKRFVCYSSPDKKDRMECLYCSPVETTKTAVKREANFWAGWESESEHILYELQICRICYSQV